MTDIEGSKSSYLNCYDETFSISSLPKELLVLVLSWVPAIDLVHQCSSVCKCWMDVTRSSTLWRLKCERERKYVPGIMGFPPSDFMKFYFKSPYTRNLLRNVRALERSTHWERSETERSSQWERFETVLDPEVEDIPYGAKPVREFVDVDGPVKNWVTSYRMGMQSQTINLLHEGCTEEVLDHIKPDIYVSVWCAARWDCGSKFFFTVYLLDDQKQTVDEFTVEKDLQERDLRQKWHLVDHTFTDYGAGTRYISVKLGGKDTQFWAGNYGSKFTLPSVRFVFRIG